MPVSLRELNKEKKYSEISREWDKSKNHDTYNEWDYLFCMNAFFALKQYGRCIDVYKECAERGLDCSKLEDRNGWATYHLVLKNYDFTKSSEEFLRICDRIIAKCKISSVYSPRNKVAELVIKAVKNGKISAENKDALIEKYLLLQDVSTLSREERELNGRKISSEYEHRFSMLSKTLLSLGKYRECIKICDEALNKIDKFHSNNDAWFRYRKAKSYRGLGDEQTGLELITEALSGRFSHWCLYEYLFDNAVMSSDEEKAKEYAAKCSIADKEHKMRISFYEKYAAYLDAHEDSRTAMLLRRLVLLVRESENWGEKACFAEWQIDPSINEMSMDDVLKELEVYWKQYADSDKTDGRILRILADGNSGFITDSVGNTYYFNARDFKSGKSKMTEGRAVKFRLIEGFDKKKGIATQNAIDITI